MNLKKARGDRFREGGNIYIRHPRVLGGKPSHAVLVCLGCCNKILKVFVGWLINNRNLFLTVLEAGKSKFKVPA